MKDFVDKRDKGAVAAAVRQAEERLQRSSPAYRKYLKDEMERKAEEGISLTSRTRPINGADRPAVVSEVSEPKELSNFAKKSKRSKGIFTKSHINDYVPPEVSKGVYGFKVNAKILTEILDSDRPELSNVDVRAIPDDGSEKVYAVKADNNAGNKFLSEIAKPKPAVQVDALMLERILNSENSVLKAATIDVESLDSDEAGFAERPYKIHTNNDKAYSLIRAIAVDVVTPYEGEIIDEAYNKPDVQPDNVVDFPRETSKIRFGGLKRLARAAAVVLAGIVTPWSNDVEPQQALNLNSTGLLPTAAQQPDLRGDSLSAFNVHDDIVNTFIAPEFTELDFEMPALTEMHISETSLVQLFQMSSPKTAPVILTEPAPLPTEPNVYVTQSGDTLWGIVEREFEEQGIDKGEGYSQLFARLDQYVEANPSLAYNPNALPVDYSLTIPVENSPRADCNWSRARSGLMNVCTPTR